MKIFKILKILIPIVIIIAILSSVSYFFKPWRLFEKKETKVYSTKTTIEKLIPIKELLTTEVTYNSVFVKYSDNIPEDAVDKKDTKYIDYYVKYDGIVKTGIDVDKIREEVDEENKIRYIILPDVEIKECIVNFGSMNFIMKKSKNEEARINSEAHKLCIEDLQNKVASDEKLNEIIRDDTKSVVETLMNQISMVSKDPMTIIVEYYDFNNTEDKVNMPEKAKDDTANIAENNEDIELEKDIVPNEKVIATQNNTEEPQKDIVSTVEVTEGKLENIKPSIISNGNEEFYCPKCRDKLNDQQGFDSSLGLWVCKKCKTVLMDNEMYGGDKHENICWICDSCGDLLNKQDGFSDINGIWICKKCGFKNKISEDEIVKK